MKPRHRREDRRADETNREPQASRKGQLVIHYRSFKNPDPPLLAEVWNTCLSGPRTVTIPARSTGLLEYFTLAKPYFDPEGMVLAFDDGRPVGLAHLGFASTPNEKALDYQVGVICSLGVIPSHRGQGIGSELLRRVEAYAQGRGAKRVVAGPAWPANPFTFGLYGGSNSAGFLAAQEGGARQFFEKHGYRLVRTISIQSRSLKRTFLPTDPRFLGIHPKHDIVGAPLSRASWWRECVLGPIEAVEYRLQEKRGQAVVGRVVLWDMATFSMNWGESAVGLLDMEVRADLRRQGLGKYLLAQVLMHLHHQTFDRFEVCVDTSNAAMLGLLHGLGFEQVEMGHCFEKP
ncbi:MAG: GNAT family N-acetyltransferase [Gemmataceae bacterium]